jgi:hypothetical protein
MAIRGSPRVTDAHKCNGMKKHFDNCTSRASIVDAGLGAISHHIGSPAP